MGDLKILLNFVGKQSHEEIKELHKKNKDLDKQVDRLDKDLVFLL
jgi:cell division protein FtsB